jgi:hypothetical protein
MILTYVLLNSMRLLIKRRWGLYLIENSSDVLNKQVLSAKYIKAKSEDIWKTWDQLTAWKLKSWALGVTRSTEAP